MQSHYGFLREKSFYKEFRDRFLKTVSVKGSRSGKLFRQRVLATVEDLRKKAPIFKAMSRAGYNKVLSSFADIVNPIPDKSRKISRDLRFYAKDLKKYTVFYPAIFSLLNSWVFSPRAGKAEARAAYKCFGWIAAFAQRIAHVNKSFNPNPYEADIAELAKLITLAKIDEASDIKEKLKGLDASNDQIMQNDVYRRKMINQDEAISSEKAKHILLRFTAVEHPELKLSDAEARVDHVLPKKADYDSSWGNSYTSKEEMERYAGCLGNMVLLKKNQRPAATSFIAKKSTYQASGIPMTKEIGGRTEWVKQSITARQQELAKLAAETWNFR